MNPHFQGSQIMILIGTSSSIIVTQVSLLLASAIESNDVHSVLHILSFYIKMIQIIKLSIDWSCLMFYIAIRNNIIMKRNHEYYQHTAWRGVTKIAHNPIPPCLLLFDVAAASILVAPSL
jgi:hypothetical protein